MSFNNTVRNVPKLKFMDQQQIDKIHEATLDILEQTGVWIDHEEALELLEKNGARIDRNNNRVYFPRDLVLEQIKLIPKSWEWMAKDPEKAITLDAETVCFTPSVGLQLFDYETKQSKTPTRKEFYDHIRVTTALKNVDGMICFPLWGFENVPQAMCMIESMAAKLRISDKPQMEGSTTDDYKFIIEMAEATNQNVIMLVNPVAPLKLDSDTINKIFFIEDHGQPYHIAAGPSAGVSAPITVAGYIASHNAILLATMVLGQLYKPGSPMLAGGFMFVSNMKTLNPSFGDLGNSLGGAVFNQMWNYYGIPCSGITGAFTSSKDMDYQAGYEETFGLLSDVLSGANVNMYSGGIYAELTESTEKLILDDDVIGMAKRYIQGVEISDESLALETIDAVGPAPGTYVGEEHTLDHLYDDTYIPLAADRDDIPTWVESGMKGAYGKAQAIKEEILAKPIVNVLSDEEEAKLEAILQKAREYYRAAGMISDEEWELYQKDLNSPGYPFA